MKHSTTIIISIVIAAVAFYGGMTYGKANASTSSQDRGARTGQQVGQQRGGMRGGLGFISGEIIAKDDTSITIQSRDGGSKIVFVSGATQVMKSVPGTTNDLTIGEQVMTNGTANADGSVVAESVQIRPVSNNKK